MDYIWNGTSYTEKEIVQMIGLTKDWAAGSGSAIDLRKITKKVLRWAENFGLVKLGKECKGWDWETGEEILAWYVNNPNRYYISDDLQSFYPAAFLPPEALWKMVEEILEDCPAYNEGVVGKSVTQSKKWVNLNINSESSKWYSDKDDNQIVEIFCTLAQHRYIIFQQAGSIWQITITPELAIRSDFQ